MYSQIVDGKVLDYHYKKMIHNHGYFFYIGDIYIGQMFSINNYWAIVPRTQCKICPINGFKTRFYASETLLKLAGYNLRED